MVLPTVIWGAVFIASDAWMGYFGVFPSARVRDGSMGRLNMWTVQVARMSLWPWAYMVLLLSPPPPAAITPLVVFVTMPWAVADSMAELVGSAIGRLEFTVVGFGDINRKTVEGVLGGWLTAFGINHLVIHVSGQNWPEAHFVVSTLAVSAIAATAIMAAETLSPRGTDDGTCLLAAALTLRALWQG